MSTRINITSQLGSLLDRLKAQQRSARTNKATTDARNKALAEAAEQRRQAELQQRSRTGAQTPRPTLRDELTAWRDRNYAVAAAYWQVVYGETDKDDSILRVWNANRTSKVEVVLRRTIVQDEVNTGNSFVSPGGIRWFLCMPGGSDRLVLVFYSSAYQYKKIRVNNDFSFFSDGAAYLTANPPGVLEGSEGGWVPGSLRTYTYGSETWDGIDLQYWKRAEFSVVVTKDTVKLIDAWPAELKEAFLTKPINRTYDGLLDVQVKTIGPSTKSLRQNEAGVWAVAFVAPDNFDSLNPVGGGVGRKATLQDLLDRATVVEDPTPNVNFNLDRNVVFTSLRNGFYWNSPFSSGRFFTETYSSASLILSGLNSYEEVEFKDVTEPYELLAPLVLLLSYGYGKLTNRTTHPDGPAQNPSWGWTPGVFSFIKNYDGEFHLKKPFSDPGDLPPTDPQDIEAAREKSLSYEYIRAKYFPLDFPKVMLTSGYQVPGSPTDTTQRYYHFRTPLTADGAVEGRYDNPTAFDNVSLRRNLGAYSQVPVTINPELEQLNGDLSDRNVWSDGEEVPVLAWDWGRPVACILELLDLGYTAEDLLLSPQEQAALIAADPEVTGFKF